VKGNCQIFRLTNNTQNQKKKKNQSNHQTLIMHILCRQEEAALWLTSSLFISLLTEIATVAILNGSQFIKVPFK